MAVANRRGCSPPSPPTRSSPRPGARPVAQARGGPARPHRARARRHHRHGDLRHPRRGDRRPGPAIILSFVLAGVTCAFSALSYAEMASTIPVAGSAYTYSYATMGELVAWIIGWDLILEYGVSVAAVAVGWGGYLNELLDTLFGFTLPDVDLPAAGRGRRRQPAGRVPRARRRRAADARHPRDARGPTRSWSSSRSAC